MLLLKYNLYKFNYFKHQININNLMFKPFIVFDMDGVLRVEIMLLMILLI